MDKSKYFIKSMDVKINLASSGCTKELNSIKSFNYKILLKLFTKWI